LRWTPLAGLALLVPALAAAQLTGALRGQVIDHHTRQPLPGANVVLLGLEQGAMADDQGHFALERVPVGTHRLQASMIGYAAQVRPDVVVRPGRVTALTIALSEVVLGLENTLVKADYFSAVEEESVSAVNFNSEEIRRSPGSAQDISRLLQAMPSVNLNTDQRNDLIVRGGSPAENLTLVDGIEVPNINHFPTQGASGGPIGLLNVDLIEEASFFAGGFSAPYGDRLSSVLSIDLRQGNRRAFDGELNMGMAGAGFIFEGPLPQGRGAWLASARRSYLDLIVGAIGTGAVPQYSDVQGKLTWDLNSRHHFSLLVLGGFDYIDIAPQDQDENDDHVLQEVDQYVLGGGWKWLWSSRGFAQATLAYTQADFAIDVSEGESRRSLYANHSQERALALRSRLYLRLRPGSALTLGLDAKRIFSDFAIFAAADTNRLGLTVPLLDLGEEVATHKLGLYLSGEQTLFHRLRATLGLRYDYFAYNQEHDLSPRLSLGYDLDEGTSLNAAFGVYYQNLPPSLLVQHPDNRLLENPRALHYVLGLQRRLTPSTRLTLELYAKEYDELPYDPDDPTVSVFDAYADFGAPAPGGLIGNGRASSRGFELLVQKKLAQDLYGSLSYAHARSRYTDLSGAKRHRNFDNRHLSSLILGYRPSDRWEYSLRWSYAGGRPYTPFDEELSRLLGTGVVRPDQVNARRLPPYHRLDLRLDHRQHYRAFNVVSFFSLLNAYNRANLFTYYWDQDQERVGRIDQWSIIPVGGFELEF
jgi:hypothetical protein